MNSSINWHTWLVSFLPHAQQGLSGRFPEPSYLLRSSPLSGSSPPLLASLTPGLLAIPDPSPPPQTSDLPRSLHCPTVLWSQTLWHPAGWLAGCPPWCTERQLAFLLTCWPFGAPRAWGHVCHQWYMFTSLCWWRMWGPWELTGRIPPAAMGHQEYVLYPLASPEPKMGNSPGIKICQLEM